ncbi:MAG: hypothetical protein WAM97_10245 [Acidimicrobiales bacterium]
MTLPVGLPYVALPLTTALSVLSLPNAILEFAAVVVVDEGAVPVVTSKHSSVVVSELAA